jgi:S1-C subfamily serine protease
MRKHVLAFSLLAMAAVFTIPAPAQVIVAPRAQVLRSTGIWIGVSVLDVTEERVKELKLKDEHGVEVITVAPDGPAQKAGLKEHDVILDYNGTRLEGLDQFKRMLSETPAGRTVKLLISRDGATQTIGVKVEERASGRRGQDGNTWAFSMPSPPSPPSPPTPAMPRMPRLPIQGWNGDLGNLFDGFDIFGNTPRLGIEGQEIGGQLGEYFGVPDKTGVLVRAVSAGSAAERAGLKAGDVITKVGGKHVQDMGDLREAIRDNAGKSIPLMVIRNKKEMTLTVTVEKMESRLGDHV